MFTYDSKGVVLQPDLETALFGASAPVRVLVVDDDPATGHSLSLIGEKEGFQVVSVDDGRKAYRMLKSDANFAAAVFNMTMPSLKGLDLVRHMKTEKRLMRIPVVIVAGDNGLQLISESFAAGALAFLPKPFTQEKLARTLRLAIGNQAGRKSDVRPGKLAA
jgi:two-component system chemotaxis response regulator CheY